MSVAQIEAPEFATRLAELTDALADTAAHHDASGEFPHANFTLLHEQPTQTAAFDAALAAFLGRPAPVTGRSLASRCQGARRLVVCQALLVGLQAGGLLLLLALR